MRKDWISEVSPVTHEDLILGLDLGIASIGWAVLGVSEAEQRIVDAGVYCFDPPEEGAGAQRTSRRARHGAKKRQTRQLAHRVERMTAIRKLLKAQGLITDDTVNSIARVAEACISTRTSSHGTPIRLSPWELRTEALTRQLTKFELAVALYHLAGHRGYRSNAKRNSNSNSENATNDEQGKVLAALSANQTSFEAALLDGSVRSAGEWLAKRDCQRNKSGDYKHTIYRRWIEDEAKLIFERQRSKGAMHATPDFERAYLEVAFTQRPIRVQAVGKCTFEPSEDRAARHSYSFELFRLLARLNNLKIVEASGATRSLDAGEIETVAALIGVRDKSLTYKHVRAILKLPKSSTFDRVGDEAEDIVGRTRPFAPGSAALRAVITHILGEPGWTAMVRERKTLDQIASCLAHETDLSLIASALSKLDLEPELKEEILRQADGGSLGFFKGSGHLSNLVISKIEPHLISGFGYYDALRKEGYDAARDASARKPIIEGRGPQAIRKWLSSIVANGKPQLENVIDSQTASRAVRQAFKQVLAIVQRHPKISQINVEMARDVSNGIKKRVEIERDQRSRERYRVEQGNSFQSRFDRAPSDRELERWILFQQQAGMCIFCGVSMRDQDVKDGRLDLQIEHAIPLSRGGPKGLSNVVLCHAGCNQNKGSMTPYEWISNGKAGRAQDWSAFSSRVRAIFKGKAFKSKIENLLVTDMKGRDSAFKERDLNDTRWISKFVIAGLKHLGTDDQPIEVIPVNAGLIGTLRYAWGLDAWKREPTDRKKRRLDDRHHALDAAIVACVDRALIQRLTRAYQLAEEREDYFEARGFPPPWRTFQRDLVERIYGRGAYDEGPAKFVGDSLRGIFVVREEIRRARGPIHSENPSSVRIRDGREVAFKSITLAEFKAAHLEKLKDRNDPRNLRLVRLLTEWIAKGSPPDDPPRIPYRRSDGAMVEQPVRRVQIECAVPPVRYNTGSDIGHGRPKPGASNEGMPRIDLFLSIEKGSPKFLAVPIYRSSLTSSMPPRQAIVSGTPRELPPDAVFRMSLYKKTPVRVTDTSGRSAIGYFQYFDTDSSRLEIWPQYSLDPSLRGRVAVGKLASIERVGVDRLGAVLPGAVDDMKGRSERRTWHGKVCT